MKRTKPLESKKFLLATAAIGAACIVWAASFVAVLSTPPAAAHVVSLATMITTLLGAVAGAGITGESFVDWRHASSVSTATINERHEEIEEHIFRCEKLDPKDLDNLED